MWQRIKKKWGEKTATKSFKFNHNFGINVLCGINAKTNRNETERMCSNI